MGGLIPLTDASRRPVRVPIVTAYIILTNFVLFALELRGGDAFVLKWAAVAAHITSGHDWITILTAMFMHGSWSHTHTRTSTQSERRSRNSEVLVTIW
ncbi:MAG TPA: rhomboid family intramembrane serine protease [Bryobacteraceae bacterium]|nr:rhomboid family intramembrane serine protease [Bryobacteraceae bacterium]